MKPRASRRTEENLNAQYRLGQEARPHHEKRTAINHARKSRVRTFTRKVEEAIAAGDKAAADGSAEGGGARDHARASARA